MSLLTEKDLNKIEERYIQACKGDLDISATIMEQMRRTLIDNKRLVVGVNSTGNSEYLEDMNDNEVIPFPVSE